MQHEMHSSKDSVIFVNLNVAIFLKLKPILLNHPQFIPIIYICSAFCLVPITNNLPRVS